MSVDESHRGYAWEQAKQPSDSPRAAGAFLEHHARADEDLREHESRLRSEVSDAERAADTTLVYQAHHRLGLHLEALGVLEQAERALNDAVAASQGDPQLSNCHAAAMNDHAIVLARLGRHQEAESNLERASDLANRAAQHALALSALRNQGLMASVGQHSAVAFKLWDTAFRAARQADDPVANAQILNNVAVIRLHAGEVDQALQLLNRAILLAQRGGDIRGLAFTYNNLGLIFSGPPRGDHFAAIPFAEMALALTDSVDILARLYALNNNIIIYEQAHLEPARKLRTQFAETLKSFTSAYPHRSEDIERTIYTRNHSNSDGDSAADDEWEISAHPVLLRSCSRCGVQK